MNGSIIDCNQDTDLHESTYVNDQIVTSPDKD